MTKLVHYEAARQALDAAVQFDDVMNIMNVAEQAELYARQANDNELISKATEIRVRAQRKAGEMLKKAKEAGQIASHGGDRKSTSQPSNLKLSDIGVSADQSSRYQALAAMPPEHFETAVSEAKATAGEVTTAFMLREAAKHKPRSSSRKQTNADKKRMEELKASQARGVSMVSTYGRLLLTALRSVDELSVEESALMDEIVNAIHQVSA